MRCTAVLLNWRRPWNISPIVDRLRSCATIAEVIVWNNSNVPLPETGADTVIQWPDNICTLGRFKAAAAAKHEIIFSQDDDMLVDNIDELLETFEANPDKIVAGLIETHYRVEANKKPWLALGWGSVLHRDWIGVLDKWRAVYGEDELLERKADRIFTVLHGKHHPIPAKVTRLKDPNSKFSDTSHDALYRRADHHVLTMQAVRLAEELRRAS